MDIPQMFAEDRSSPAPLSQHEALERAGQLGEIRLCLQVENEVQDGVVRSLVHDAGDDAPVLGEAPNVREVAAMAGSWMPKLSRKPGARPVSRSIQNPDHAS